MFPAEVTGVARLEELDADLRGIGRRFNISFRRPNSLANVEEGGVHGGDAHYLAKAAPRALAKLLMHLHQDYVCLQYPMPSVAALAAS